MPGFRNLRSDCVLGCSSEAVLLEYNELLYSGKTGYAPGNEKEQEALFPWEEEAISRYFPRPPARILIGAAGSGREAFALARMGYEVVAFEPVDCYVQAMQHYVPKDLNVRVCKACYEELPFLTDTTSKTKINLEDIAPFDAAIIGWQSFSIIQRPSTRRSTLEWFMKRAQGPVLLSYACRNELPMKQNLGRVRRWLRSILSHGQSEKWDEGDFFTARFGYRHRFTASEITQLTTASGGGLIHVTDPDNMYGGFNTAYAIIQKN